MNVDANCILCFHEFVTSIEAIQDGDAECPNCHGGAVTQQPREDGYGNRDDDDLLGA